MSVQPSQAPTLMGLLNDLASPQPLPGSGVAVAYTTAMAAAVLSSIARRSQPIWPEAGDAASRAEGLRRQAIHLMTANEAAYGEALSAIADPAALDLDQKLDTAAKSPLRIGAIAADVAKLGRACAEHGVADAKADAESATLLAEACAGSSALLVGTNRNVTATDEVAEQANAFARPVDTD